MFLSSIKTEVNGFISRSITTIVFLFMNRQKETIWQHTLAVVIYNVSSVFEVSIQELVYFILHVMGAEKIIETFLFSIRFACMDIPIVADNL